MLPIKKKHSGNFIATSCIVTLEYAYIFYCYLQFPEHSVCFPIRGGLLGVGQWANNPSP